MSRRLLASFAVLAGLFTSLASVSCQYQPSGGLFASSTGSFTYYSTAEYPKTFVLVDTSTGENIFEMHIPVGKALVVQFVKDQGDDETTTPDLMRYGVFPIGGVSGLLSSSIPVPGSYSRRIDIFMTTGEVYTPPDPNRPIRTDTKEDRPPGWTDQGGPRDEVAPDPIKLYDP